MIIVDTSGLIAAVDASDPRHDDVATVFTAANAPFVVSPFVLAEADSLVATRWGVERELALLDEVMRSFDIAPFDADDMVVARKVISRYADQEIGLADASVVVLAQRHRTRRILTLDERHFRVLRGPGNRPFELLPADR